VKSRMRIVGMLSGVVLVALPFGLGGCGTTTSPSPTQLPSLSPTPIGSPTETPKSSEPSTAVISPTPKPTLTPKINEQAQVYWLNSGKTKLELMPAKVSPAPTSKDPKVQLTTAIERLLVGPASKEMTTAIPTGTKLKLMTVKADGIHVDLSKDFGSGGGSVSMQSRLGQVIYTASSLNSADPVWISVEGGTD
jgi:spore germination protein GerM